MNSYLDVIKASNPILEIQFYLKDIAQHNPEIPMIMPSGTFDAKTQRAVSEFQRMLGLPVTGKIDYVTWDAIKKEHSNLIHKINMPSYVCCFPNNMEEYKKGDECNLICILQIILKNFNKKYKNYPDVELTSIFDDKTEAAVKQFQKCSNIPVTGILDRKTWNILNEINKTCKLYE